MSETKKTRDDEGGAPEGAQRRLTTSVGTPLMKQEKSRRRRVFGGRRKQPRS